MRRQQRIRISVEGWVYVGIMLFILAGALVRQINLLMVLFGMLAGPLVVSWRLVKATLRRLEVGRKLPDSISAGDLLVVELSLKNPRRWLGSWAAAVTDRIRREGTTAASRALEPAVLFAYLPPRASRAATYRGRLNRRGRYQFGPLRLSTRFPLGLLEYRVACEAPGNLVVFPRLGRLLAAWERLQQSTDQGLGPLARQQGLLEGEFYGLRDWRMGDSRRWIHWRTSARRQAPVVRQFEQQRSQDLALVVELWHPRRPSAEHADTVELAVSFAATITAEACRRGGRWLSLAASGQTPFVRSGPTSTALLHQCMTDLALAEADAHDRLPATLADVLDRVRPGTRVIVVTSRPMELSDTERFQELWNHTRRRAWLGKICAIDAGGDELADYFSAD